MPTQDAQIGNTEQVRARESHTHDARDTHTAFITHPLNPYWEVAAGFVLIECMLRPVCKVITGPTLLPLCTVH